MLIWKEKKNNGAINALNLKTMKPSVIATSVEENRIIWIATDRDETMMVVLVPSKLYFWKISEEGNFKLHIFDLPDNLYFLMLLDVTIIDSDNIYVVSIESFSEVVIQKLKINFGKNKIEILARNELKL